MLENLEVLRDSEKITTERSNTCDDFLTIGFRDQGDSSVHRRLAVLSSTHEKMSVEVCACTQYWEAKTGEGEFEGMEGVVTLGDPWHLLTSQLRQI